MQCQDLEDPVADRADAREDRASGDRDADRAGVPDLAADRSGDRGADRLSAGTDRLRRADAAV